MYGKYEKYELSCYAHKSLSDDNLSPEQLSPGTKTSLQMEISFVHVNFFTKEEFYSTLFLGSQGELKSFTCIC